MTEPITLANLRDWLDRAQRGELNTETAVETAVALYQSAAAAIDAYKGAQADIKALLTEIMTETGQTSYTTPAGKCYVSSSSTVTTYDSKGLDALAANDDELAALLAPFRRVTERAGVLTVRAPAEAKPAGEDTDQVRRQRDRYRAELRRRELEETGLYDMYGQPYK